MSEGESFPKPLILIPELSKRDAVFRAITTFAKNAPPEYDDSLIHFYWALANDDLDQLPGDHDFEATKSIAADMANQGLIEASVEEKIRNAVDKELARRTNRLS